MILFFYGAESYQSQQKIGELVERFLRKNPSGAGLLRFDLADGDGIVDIAQALPAASLFTQRRLIILRNLFALPAPQQREVAQLLAQIDADTVVVIHEPTNPRKNSVLLKMLLKDASQSHIFDQLDGAKLEYWIARQIAQFEPKATITKQAVQALVHLAGNDLWRLSNELEKLFARADDGKITAELVGELVHGEVAGDVFATVEAITAQNAGRALTLLERQLLSGDDPHKIFAMYVYQVRTLLAVGSFVWAGSFDARQIAQKAKLHPFVVSKAMSVVRKLPQADIMKLHANLANYDHAIKTGKQEPKVALSLLVASTCA